MKLKTIEFQHPLAHVKLTPHQPLPNHVYKKIKKGLHGLLNAAQDLMDDWEDQDLDKNILPRHLKDDSDD